MENVRITEVDYIGRNQFYDVVIGGVGLRIADFDGNGVVDSYVKTLVGEDWRLYDAFFAQHRSDIQQAVTRFRADLPTELARVKGCLGEPHPGPTRELFCDRGDERVKDRPTIYRECLNKPTARVEDSDRDGHIDNMRFFTQGGVHVSIKSWKTYTVHLGGAYRIHPCFDTDDQRDVVEQYLSIFDANFAPASWYY